MKKKFSLNTKIILKIRRYSKKNNIFVVVGIKIRIFHLRIQHFIKNNKINFTNIIISNIFQTHTISFKRYFSKLLSGIFISASVSYLISLSTVLYRNQFWFFSGPAGSFSSIQTLSFHYIFKNFSCYATDILNWLTYKCKPLKTGFWIINMWLAGS